MPQYRFGGCIFVNNTQYVWDYPVAPNVVMIFIDEQAQKMYKKYGVQYGQCPIEEYDTVLVQPKPQEDPMAKILNELSSMRADIDSLKQGGVSNVPD